MSLDAGLRFTVAVGQLVEPERVRIDRYRAEIDPATASTLAGLDEQRTRLRAAHAAAHAAARGRRDAAGMRRSLARLIASEGAYRASTAGSGTVPALLDQLRDAVESSSSTGGGHAAPGAHRSPIGLDAAELLGLIRRCAGTDTPAGIRAWSELAAGRADDTELTELADHAEQWVAAARQVIAPDRTFEARAACPQCGTRHVRAPDPLGGGTTLRAAIQISYASRSARCIAPGCTAYWDRHHLPLLAAALECDTPAQRAG